MQLVVAATQTKFSLPSAESVIKQVFLPTFGDERSGSMHGGGSFGVGEVWRKQDVNQSKKLCFFNLLQLPWNDLSLLHFCDLVQDGLRIVVTRARSKRRLRLNRADSSPLMRLRF